MSRSSVSDPHGPTVSGPEICRAWPFERSRIRSHRHPDAGVCIGANAAIFAIVNRCCFDRCHSRSRRLVTLYNSYPRAGVERASTGVPDYYDRLRETDVFEEQALYNTAADDRRRGRPAANHRHGRPTLSLRMLRATPTRGRSFNEDEGETGHDARPYSATRCGSSSSAAGLGRRPRTAHQRRPAHDRRRDAADLLFMDPDVKLWTPLAFTADRSPTTRGTATTGRWSARLKPGATWPQAQQQIDALNARNLERFPNLKQILINAGFHTVVAPLPGGSRP